MSLYLLLGIAPLILWMLHFRNRDKNKEPWGRLFLIMSIGGISVFVAAAVERFIMSALGTHEFPVTFFPLLVHQTFIVGVTEETVKFLVVWIFAFHSPLFDEPVDGLVYSAAAALGFATVENAMYAESYGFAVWIMRVIVTCLAHIMFSAIWGYELGRYRFEHKGHIFVLLASIGISAFCHGLFNTLVSNSYLWFLGIVFIAIVLWRLVKYLYRISAAKTQLVRQTKKKFL